MLFLAIVTIPTYGQKGSNTTTHNLVVQKGNVSVVVNDKDWRMVIGNLKRPKYQFILGHNKEQAANKIDCLIAKGTNEKYKTINCIVSFCGTPCRLTVDGTGDKQKYVLKLENSKVKFSLSRNDLEEMKQGINEYVK